MDLREPVGQKKSQENVKVGKQKNTDSARLRAQIDFNKDETGTKSYSFIVLRDPLGNAHGTHHAELAVFHPDTPLERILGCALRIVLGEKTGFHETDQMLVVALE